jgi:transposase InsO family protein
VTYLPAHVQGRWYYLYLILDLYSRKIVGFEVHDTDSASTPHIWPNAQHLPRASTRRRCARCCTVTTAPA